MQPYFFPYIGYFSLIKCVEKFIFFDTAQYIRHGWVNRNRILHPNEGWQYICVSIKKTSRSTTIRDIIISKDFDWKDKIIRQLRVYEKKAPYYQMIFETDSLALMNIHIIKEICKYLGMEINYEIFSEMNLVIDNVNSPDEWALEIAKKLGYDTYINAPGGREFFDRKKYEQENINLSFIKNNLVHYYQGRKLFEPGLSIIDVLMFNSIEKTLEMIKDIVEIN
jgi:hypothetical protein